MLSDWLINQINFKNATLVKKGGKCWWIRMVQTASKIGLFSMNYRKATCLKALLGAMYEVWMMADWLSGNGLPVGLTGLLIISVQTNMGFSMFGRTEQFGQKTEQFGRTVLPNICTFKKTKITGLLRIFFQKIKTFCWFLQ